eukprot:Clim_evm72s144 gene=Clim_evmTU72s144
MTSTVLARTPLWGLAPTRTAAAASGVFGTRYYRALLTRQEEAGKGVKHTIIDTPPETGDVSNADTVVEVEYTNLNYKDALALRGVKSVMRINPMIAGIDFTGTVKETSSSDVKVGDRVLLTGWGSGENHHGGLQTEARCRAEHLIPLPSGMDGHTAMAMGTAGYTAMLCKMKLEAAGCTPDQGYKDVVVTGACGGVGSVAVVLLARAGYTVSAITGRGELEGDYLRGLGLTGDILRREDYNKPRPPSHPLAKSRWHGAVDTTGSHILANVIAELKYGGSVAACGLAAGMDLDTSVAPFILRGVTLHGVESVWAPRELRLEAWARLGQELSGVDLEKLTVVTTVGLGEVAKIAEQILSGKIRGRTVVDLKR